MMLLMLFLSLLRHAGSGESQGQREGEASDCTDWTVHTYLLCRVRHAYW
jgi:hypothetical protein